MSIRKITIDFQKQVSERLTQLFEVCLSQDNTTRDIREFLDIIVNNNGEDISIHRVLECISEPETYYYKNDTLIEGYDQDRGIKIYSPRIDLCIAPSFVKKRERKGKCLMNIRLAEYSRSYIYELFEQINIIQRLKDKIKAKSDKNYELINITPSDLYENKSPLYLFGIEIENNPDTKHLMGDFLNSYMLSKYPVVLVQKNKLEKALNLIKYIHTISELKGIDFRCLSNVNLLTIKQFTEIVNDLLREYYLSEIYLSDYE